MQKKNQIKSNRKKSSNHKPKNGSINDRACWKLDNLIEIISLLFNSGSSDILIIIELNLISRCTISKELIIIIIIIDINNYSSCYY